MVGALTITARESEHLPARKNFLERARHRLQELTPDRVDELLAGLE
jgi:hypothetical protein